MQEISPNIFIENNAIGLVTGVIRTEQGTVLVDSPLRQDDAKSWRSATARLVTSDARFLISLDSNYDRALSAKGSEYVTICQNSGTQPPKTRQSAQKLLDDSSASSDSHDSTTSNRVLPPEIVFSKDMQLHLGSYDIYLEHHPGSNHSGIWVHIPRQKVLFVGDSVLVDQPPFLAYADLAAWEEDLKSLASRTYKGYLIISARSGMVDPDQVKAMGKLISAIRHMVEPLKESKADQEAYLALIPKILKKINMDPSYEELYYNRLRWGLSTYYEQNKK